MFCNFLDVFPGDAAEHFYEKMRHIRYWKKETKKDDFDVGTKVNYGVALFLSWSKSMCNLTTDIMRIRYLLNTIASF